MMTIVVTCWAAPAATIVETGQQQQGLRDKREPQLIPALVNGFLGGGYMGKSFRHNLQSLMPVSWRANTIISSNWLCFILIGYPYGGGYGGYYGGSPYYGGGYYGG